MKNCCVFSSGHQKMQKPVLLPKCNCKSCCDRGANRDCPPIEERNYGSGSEFSADDYTCWSNNSRTTSNPSPDIEEEENDNYCWDYYCKDDYEDDMSMYDSVTADETSVMSFINSSEDYSCKCQDCGLPTYNKSVTSSEAGSADLDKSGKILFDSGSENQGVDSNRTSEHMTDFSEENSKVVLSILSANRGSDELTTETQADIDEDEHLKSGSVLREVRAIELANSKLNGSGNQSPGPCNRKSCVAFAIHQQKQHCPAPCNAANQRDNVDNSCRCQKQPPPLTNQLFKKLVSNQSNICQPPPANQLPRRSCLKKTCAHQVSPSTVNCTGADDCPKLLYLARKSQKQDAKVESPSPATSSKSVNTGVISSKTSSRNYNKQSEHVEKNSFPSVNRPSQFENQNSSHAKTPSKTLSQRHRQSEKSEQTQSFGSVRPDQSQVMASGSPHSQMSKRQSRPSEKSGLHYGTPPEVPSVDEQHSRQFDEINHHQSYVASDESPNMNGQYSRHLVKSSLQNSQHSRKLDHRASNKAPSGNHDIQEGSLHRSGQHVPSNHSRTNRVSHNLSKQHNVEKMTSNHHRHSSIRHDTAYADALLEMELNSIEYRNSIPFNDNAETQTLVYYTNTGEPVNILKRVSQRRNQQLPVNRIDDSLFRSSGSLPNFTNPADEDGIEYYLSNQDSYQGLTPVQEVSKEESTIAKAESNELVDNPYNTGSPRFQNVNENNMTYMYQQYAPGLQRHMQYTRDDVQIYPPSQEFNSITLYPTPIRSSTSAAARKCFAHSYPLKRRPNSPRRDGFIKIDRK